MGGQIQVIIGFAPAVEDFPQVWMGFGDLVMLGLAFTGVYVAFF